MKSVVNRVVGVNSIPVREHIAMGPWFRVGRLADIGPRVKAVLPLIVAQVEEQAGEVYEEG